MPVIRVPVAGTFILIDFDNHKISLSTSPPQNPVHCLAKEGGGA